jgi:type VI secretion system protein ImpH
MAVPSWRSDVALSQLVHDEPYRFEFFQAVRLLERLDPDRAPVGYLSPPSAEVVRFLTKLAISFPASQLDRLEPSKQPGGPQRLTVSFLGLTGPLGVLPHPYTELLLRRELVRDRTAAEFFDLFNHRLVSLFYRAWEKHHPIVAYERGLRASDRTSVWFPQSHDQSGELASASSPSRTTSIVPSDRLAELPPSKYLYDLVGLGVPALRRRSCLPDRVLLFYAGLFAQRHRSAGGLENLLRAYFQLPISVLPLQGQWIKLAPDDRTSLGGKHNELGSGMVLGRRVWDVQGKIRLKLGPLTFQQYLEFQPDQPAFRALSQLTRLYVNLEFDIDIQLVLKAQEIPRFGLPADRMRRPRLGRTVWLTKRELQRDAEEGIFPATD